VSIVGEADITLPTYRTIIGLRASFIPFWGKVFGILLAVAGLLALVWSDGYLVPGLLLFAGILTYFAAPPALLSRIAKRGFPHQAGRWRYGLDDDGVTWMMPDLRVTFGWPRIVALDDRHPDVLMLIVSARTGVVPLVKSAFSEADREALAAYCRDRIAATTALTMGSAQG
jgi:hypothetical protein